MLFKYGDVYKKNKNDQSSPSPHNKASSRFNKTFNNIEQVKSLNIASS